VRDFSDVVQAARMESRGAENENRSVDEKREAKRYRGIKNSVTNRFAAVARGSAESACLHNAGGQIEIVRHDRGAENADGDVKHFAIAKDFRAREKADGGFTPQRVSKKDFVSETNGYGRDQRDDESFDQAETAALQSENEKDVQRSDEHAGKKRNAEEQLQGYGGAQHFGDFADDPKEQGGASGILFAAGLREVAAGGDAEFGREGLEKHRHQVADKNDAEKRVAEFRAAAQVGGPVARVHVADGDEITGAS